MSLEFRFGNPFEPEKPRKLNRHQRRAAVAQTRGGGTGRDPLAHWLRLRSKELVIAATILIALAAGYAWLRAAPPTHSAVPLLFEKQP